MGRWMDGQRERQQQMHSRGNKWAKNKQRKCKENKTLQNEEFRKVFTKTESIPGFMTS